MLTKTAQLLRDMVRDNSLDAAFRYGGEEFCMLLPATPISAAAAVLEEYRRKVEDAEFQYEGQALKVTVVSIAGSAATVQVSAAATNPQD